MDCRVERVAPEVVRHLRALFLRELNAQFRYESVHPRHWCDDYALRIGDLVVGHASVMGQESGDRDTLFEWYVLPAFRIRTADLFQAFVDVSGVTLIESQTNDPLLYPVAHRWGTDLRPTVYFFESGAIADLPGPGLVRPRREGDAPFMPDGELGSHVLDVDGLIVASGGFLLHYNPPFADVYMEVHALHRQRGYGARLVAGVMHACWLAGRIPAARCNITNAASRATLRKAGMREIGQMMFGAIARPVDVKVDADQSRSHGYRPPDESGELLSPAPGPRFPI